MKKLIIALTVLLLANSSLLFAHDGNAHPTIKISQEDVPPIAKRMCKYLSMKDGGLGFGQLPESWASIDINNIAVEQQGTEFYVASALNPVEEKTLYILVSDNGEVYDANFTGAFAKQ